jgi:formyltetrahydrofolate deformylase
MRILNRHGMRGARVDSRPIPGSRTQIALRARFDLPPDPGANTGPLLEHVADRIRRDLDEVTRLRMRPVDRPTRVAIMVSKPGHCLMDLLDRRHELPITVVSVISNHPDHEAAVTARGDIPFHHVPFDTADKAAGEARVLELLAGQVDLVVFARWMQIASPDFLARVGMGRPPVPGPGRPVDVINLHHGLLPAFPGAKPYHQAWARGARVVGATAHYVTEVLDTGPYISQESRSVVDCDSVEDMIRAGIPAEREALTDAVRAHCEDRVLRAGLTTAVFPR